MDRNVSEGKWKQMRGKIKEKWGDFTDDDLDRIQGRKENLIGRLQERYGKSRQDAEKAASEFFDKIA